MIQAARPGADAMTIDSADSNPATKLPLHVPFFNCYLLNADNDASFIGKKLLLLSIVTKIKKSLVY